MIRKYSLETFIVVILSTALIGCHKKGDTNKLDFYKTKYAIAINHYSAPKDSLKLKALYFILNNLSDQYFEEADWLDVYKQSIIQSKKLSVNDLIQLQDSISGLYPQTITRIKDQDVIDDNYLINNIDRAFNSRNLKWARGIKFADFCEYVLPYKVGNERPETWGTALETENYLRPDSLAKIKNIFEATAYVNNHLSWYTGTLSYDYPVDMGYSLSRIVKTGTCYSMSSMAAFQIRSLGIPIATDYSPTWGNRSDGHYWNTLIFNNHSYPFDSNGPNIGFYKIEFKGIGRIPYKISKVFRRTFSVQESSLAMINDSAEDIPDVFNNKRIKDVTDEYVPTSDISLNYEKTFKNKFAYLCTFNNEAWIPSFWGTINSREITFKNMGRDMVYLPICYNIVNEKAITTPIGDPFILYSNGQTGVIKLDLKRKQTLLITRKYPEDESNKILKGDAYELFYWNGSWESLGVQIARSNELHYSNVPSKALYWIRDLTQGKQERIFTYDHNQQIWW